MTSQDTFGIVAVFYAVANLASMGLELNLRETVKSLRSVRILGLTLGWSWLVGPAFAVLLTKVLPMAEPYAMGLLICEAYGLSENVIPNACNTPEKFRLGTVGLPLQGCEIRLASDGELLVRGPGVVSH